MSWNSVFDKQWQNDWQRQAVCIRAGLKSGEGLKIPSLDGFDASTDFIRDRKML